MGGSVVVVGAGAWGTTVASLVARTSPTVLWARSPELADTIARAHENPAYLPGIRLPDSLGVTASLTEAGAEADLVLMAVPSHGFRGVLERLAPTLHPGVAVVSLAKGIEAGTDMRMSQIVAEVLPDHPAGALSGPNLAREVAE